MKQPTLQTNYSIESVENLTNVSADNIAIAIGCDEAYVRLVARLHDITEDANGEFSGKQIARFLVTAYRNLSAWMVSVANGRTKRARLRLKYYRALGQGTGIWPT